MKTYQQKYFNLAYVASLLLLLSSCAKDIFNRDYAGFDGQVLMAQAAEGRNSFSVPMSSRPWKLGFGASYGKAMTASPKDIPVEFAYKEDWIATYNQQNGTDYIPLPSGSYTISGLSSVIKAGATTSEPLSISVNSKELDVAEKYMFPITLLSAGDMKVDSALRTSWFRIDNIVRPERDVTSQGTLSVSHENGNANENSTKLVDNNTGTKFLLFEAQAKIAEGLWYRLTFPNPIVLGAYTITSGNDSPDRDPKDWRLQGSDDGTSWTTLDTKTGQAFSGRGMTIRYEFPNETAFKQYRVLISANNGGSLFQQAEWRVIEFFEQ